MFYKVMLTLLLPLFLFAGDIRKFTIETDRNKVNEGGVATVVATLVTSKKVKVKTPEFPKSELYEVVRATAHTGGGSSFYSVTVNGKRTTSSVEFSTMFYYQIRFLKKGKVTLPSLKIDINGEKATTKPIVYHVGTAAAKADSPVSVDFIRSKSTLYKNEQIPFTLRFKVKAGQNAEVTNEGFRTVATKLHEALEKKFSVVITNKEAISGKREVINGMHYTVYDQNMSLTAIDTGTVSLAPVPFGYAVHKRMDYRDNYGFPSSLFSSTTMVEEHTVSPRLTLKVVSPPNAPKGYTGIVGNVKLWGSISSDSVMVGEGITLKYTLSGKMKSADLGGITLPKLSDFEQFTPEKKTWSDSTSGKISTKKTFSHMLIPRQAGEFTIPAVEVIWFDPVSGTYKTEKAGPYTIKATASDKPANVTKRYLTKEQIATVGTDIRYIKTAQPEKKEVLKPYSNRVFVILLPLPYLLMLLLILYKLSVKLIPNDQERSMRRGALGKAYRELDKIEKGKSKGSPAGVVEQFLLKKYGISAPSMRRDELKVALIQSGASESGAEAVLAFIDAVEMSRYSGGDESDSLVKEAKKMLKQITREVN